MASITTRALLAPAMATLALALPSSASAQFGGWGDRDRYGYYESRRAGYDNGYREGLDEGEKDARRRDAFDYRDEGDWRKADKGYRRSYGDRNRYRDAFRAGFEDGYTDGYRRHAAGYGYGNGRRYPGPSPTYPNRGPGSYPGGTRYPGGYGYPDGRYGFDPAYSAGLRDGHEKGREDARDRDSYDPLRHRWYREADRGYRREYGSKQQYGDIYRQAFREGYDRGYREAAYGYRR